ncbi:hypothetical protein TanjilG_20146 [Lupinus angustifolius]|uniref:Uncharacterized protein n=1 Tax=Lupinus angustifolius TaxID=3871 RepID=A0A4P1RCV0_LUPAN|nr:hypothetical protein TanjilG_20146 [Lupinus angustifolius]
MLTLTQGTHQTAISQEQRIHQTITIVTQGQGRQGIHQTTMPHGPDQAAINNQALHTDKTIINFLY